MLSRFACDAEHIYLAVGATDFRKQIKRLEKSYNTRYHASLMENSRMVKEQGLDTFLQQQKEKYTCPECGGIISIHDAECSECQYKI